MNGLVVACREAGVRHAFGAPLRLRGDIWERMKLVLRLLGISDGIERYKEIYGFEELLGSSYVAAKSSYINKIMRKLESIIQNNGIRCGFPDYLGPTTVDKSTLGQTTLQKFLGSAN
jgi:DNA repair photolyase